MSINSRKFIIEFNNKLENAKNPFLNETEELEETSASRLISHINPMQSFAAISAERHDGELEEKAEMGDKEAQKLVQKQQEENNKNTKQLEQDIKSLGLSFIKTYGAWKENQVTFENSFFINDISKRDALKLGAKYNQWGIIFKPAGEQTGYLINTSDDYGSIAKRFDFTNTSKFSQISTIPDNLQDYTGYSGLKGKSKKDKNVGFNYSFNSVFSDDELEQMRKDYKSKGELEKAQ